MTTMKTFPQEDWQTASPADVGMDAHKLNQAKHWLDEKFAALNYRVAIVRHGYLVAEWTHAAAADTKLGIASANKSLLSCTLGIAIAAGKIRSADDRAVLYYPEMMDVPEGEGPKEGRYAFEKNTNATLRHLICNVSGYMKPGEEPGKVFNYQTNGMCVLSHAIEKTYGLYEVDDPEGSPKIPPLYQEKIAAPIGAAWDYTSGSQQMHDRARTHIFGWGSGILTSLRDFARLGWLWCNWGAWAGQQVVPEDWMRQITRIAPDILANSPENTWRYGHGFWTNQKGKLWPDLPREGFTSWGAGGHYCIVFPGYNLVVAMNPTPYPGQTQPYETHTATWLQQQEVLRLILERAGTSAARKK